MLEFGASDTYPTISTEDEGVPVEMSATVVLLKATSTLRQPKYHFGSDYSVGHESPWPCSGGGAGLVR